MISLRRAARFVLLVTLLICVSVPLAAQEGESWFVYVLSGTDNSLYRVLADGTREVINLGGDPVGSVSFSPDGALMGACVYTQGADGNPQPRYVVYDLNSGAQTITQDLSDRAGCEGGAFNSDGTALAYGIVNYRGYDPNADRSQPDWEIRIVDISSGSISNSIDAGAPGASDISHTDLTLLPDLHYFDGDRIGFSTILWAPEPGPTGLAYEWDRGIDTFATINPFDDRLPLAGESLRIAYNASLPSTEYGVAYGTSDNVLIADYPVSDSDLIHHSPDAAILDVIYINGGQEALMRKGVTNFGADTFTEDLFFTRMDRNGVTTDLRNESAQARGMVAVPGGYVLMWVQADPAGSGEDTVTLVANTGGEERELATLTGIFNANLVWGTPVETPQAVMPFLPVGLNMVERQAPPLCEGAPTTRLIVGERARITPGDPNNVRTIPETGGEVVGQIPGGGEFAVLDGPVCDTTNGFAWWQVEYEGVVGWTVEGSGDTYWTEPISGP